MAKPTEHPNPSVRCLAEVRIRLDLNEQTRGDLLKRRDECIDKARADGVAWADINVACGVANMQRSYDRRMQQ